MIKSIIEIFFTKLQGNSCFNESESHWKSESFLLTVQSKILTEIV